MHFCFQYTSRVHFSIQDKIDIWIQNHRLDRVVSIGPCYAFLMDFHHFHPWKSFQMFSEVMFSGWVFYHVLQYTTFHGMSSFFVLCHVPLRVWVSELCKRLVLCFMLHVFHILLGLCSQPCYRFSVYVTVLHILHVFHLSIEYQVWGIFIAIITSFRWTTC